MNRPYPPRVRRERIPDEAPAVPPLLPTQTITRPVHWMEHRVKWLLRKSADARLVAAECTFIAHPNLHFTATAERIRQDPWKPPFSPSDVRHLTNECQHEAFAKIIKDVHDYNQTALHARRVGM